MISVPRRVEVKGTVTEKLAFFVFIFRKCLVRHQEPAKYSRGEKGILDSAAGVRELMPILCSGNCQMVQIKMYIHTGQWWDWMGPDRLSRPSRKGV